MSPSTYLLLALNVASPPGIGKRRVLDVDFPLADAVDAQRLLVDVGAEPVVENAVAGANRHAAVLAGRPRQAETRAEAGQVVHVRLHFVAQAGTERQVRAQPHVVLHVDAALEMRIDDQRIADALREVAGPAVQERLAVGKGEGAEIVRGAVGAVVAAFELDAGAHGVDAAHVVQVRRQLDVLLVDAAGDLRAAARDAVEHADGLRFELRRGFAAIQAQLQAGVQEHVRPDRPRLLHPHLVAAVLVRIRALGEVESADAEIAARRVVLRVADAQHVTLAQVVVEHAVRVPAVVRPPAEQRRGLAASVT